MIPPPATKDLRVYILVPGVKTRSSDYMNWAVRMASCINIDHDRAKGDEFRYNTSAILHRFGMRERVKFVVELARRYWRAGYEPIFVAHSDGCEIVRRAILEGPSIFLSAHLIAGACSADFERNGLNRALIGGKVGQIYCYVSKGDRMLSVLARVSKSLFGWLGFGFGTLGYDGPQNVPKAMQGRDVKVIARDNLRHGDWFKGANWKKTFDSVTQIEPPKI